jgi:hypothetical protein
VLDFDTVPDLQYSQICRVIYGKLLIVECPSHLKRHLENTQQDSGPFLLAVLGVYSNKPGPYLPRPINTPQWQSLMYFPTSDVLSRCITQFLMIITEIPEIINF